MTVAPTASTPTAVHAGETFYFCSPGCRTKFAADPHRFAHGATAGTEDFSDAPADAVWTCPMHPEILRDAPGSCPICGMALEPVMPGTDSGPSAEYRDMVRRFWIGLALALPVFALEMGGHLTGLHQLLARQTGNWL